jgi:hypothetical protein
LASLLAPLATAGWQLVEGTADGFGQTGLPFEALDNGEQRVTLWHVVGETWITAALRAGWDATARVPDTLDTLAVVSALLIGDVERDPIEAPRPPLFAGLFGRGAAEPAAGFALRAAGLALTEWPVSSKGGVFSNVSPARGTGS